MPKNVLLHPGSQVAERFFAQVVDFEELRQRIVAVGFDERVQVQERALNAAQQHHFVKKVIRQRTRCGEMPDQCSQAADHQFNPNAREDDPLTRSSGLEQKNVRGIGKKCRSEIDKQKTHLMDLTAKMFTSKPVTKLVYGTQTQEEDPKDPDVV